MKKTAPKASIHLAGNIQSHLLRIVVFAFIGTVGHALAQNGPALTNESAKKQPASATSGLKVDHILARSRDGILAELKNAKSYRLAARAQNRDFFTPEKELRFNAERLNNICADVMSALFKDQTRVTVPSPPTSSVERDGIEHVKATLQQVYPKCRTPMARDKVDDVLSRDGGWKNQDIYISASALRRPETRIYIQESSVFLATARTPEKLSVLMAAGSLNECPIYSDEIGIGVTSSNATQHVASFVQIDDKLSQISLLHKPLYPDDDSELLGLSQKQFEFEIFNESPQDKPRRGEKMLVVNLPPYSPVMPPIAEMILDWVPNNDPYKDPRFSKSVLPSCFIYFR